jgi:hypothetical protein
MAPRRTTTRQSRSNSLKGRRRREDPHLSNTLAANEQATWNRGSTCAIDQRPVAQEHAFHRMIRELHDPPPLNRATAGRLSDSASAPMMPRELWLGDSAPAGPLRTDRARERSMRISTFIVRLRPGPPPSQHVCIEIETCLLICQISFFIPRTVGFRSHPTRAHVLNAALSGAAAKASGTQHPLRLAAQFGLSIEIKKYPLILFAKRVSIPPRFPFTRTSGAAQPSMTSYAAYKEFLNGRIV